MNSYDHGNTNYDYSIKGPRGKSFKANGTLHEPKIIDHISKNHMMVKEIKNYNFEKSKMAIENVYE